MARHAHGLLEVPAVPLHRWLLPISLVALIAGASQPALAAPSIEGAIEARGTASTFTIIGGGLAREGGTHDWSIVCGGCLVRLTLSATDGFMVVQDGRVHAYGPGTYELREFRGLVQVWETGRGAFDVQVHGTGSVAAWT